MKVTRGARLQAKLMRGLRDGSIKLSIKAIPPDRSDGFHGLFERDRPKFVQMPLGPGASYDSFGRRTDELSFPDDVTFYRGVIVSAHAHIDHLLDDLCYRLAQLEAYKGQSKFWAKTDAKLRHLGLVSASGPMTPFRRRILTIRALYDRFLTFRNLLVHGEVALHVTLAKQRIVGVRKFGSPTSGGTQFQDTLERFPVEYLSRRAARLDRLARHVNRLSFELCRHLSLPGGLMEIEP